MVKYDNKTIAQSNFTKNMSIVHNKSKLENVHTPLAPYSASPNWLTVSCNSPVWFERRWLNGSLHIGLKACGIALTVVGL